MEKPILYFAAGLFHFGDRYRNAIFVKHLNNLGYRVIVPQQEALKFKIPDQLVDLAEDCFAAATNPKHLLVIIADGPDPDAGAAVEYGAAMYANRKAIFVRTDPRTAMNVEAGVNAMFRLRGTQHVIFPCHATEINQFDDYCKDLAYLVHQAVETAMAV